MGRVQVLGVGFDSVAHKEATRTAIDLIEGGGVHQVVTAGAELVMMARRDSDLGSILDRAALVVSDGAGVVWASRLLHPPGLPARVTGVDLTASLISQAARRRWPVFLLGAKPAVLEALVTRLRETYPELDLAGACHGYFDPARERAIATEIARANPRLLLVALGQPRQEKFIASYQGLWQDLLAMGVGGAFDVLSGATPRAPAWMQRGGLEWLYRLMREPKRWRRQLALPAFVLAVLRSRFFGQKG
ncbi:MAG: WecB/TagA/CpsF family glycosyltransferase [Bacillota bacterium]